MRRPLAFNVSPLASTLRAGVADRAACMHAFFNLSRSAPCLFSTSEREHRVRCDALLDTGGATVTEP